MKPFLCLCTLVLCNVAAYAASGEEVLRSGWYRKVDAYNVHAWHHKDENAVRRIATTRPPPCDMKNNVTVNVSSLADLNLRLKYPNSQLVFLVLQHTLVLKNATFIFNNSFSCTIVKSAKRTGAYGFTGTTDKFPVVQVYKATNIIFYGVNFKGVYSYDSSGCDIKSITGPNIGQTCAAFYVAYCWGIQLTKGSIYGNIQFTNSWYSRVDSCNINVPAGANAGVITAYMGDGPNVVPSQLYISNNYFSTTANNTLGATFIRQSVGITLNNNNFKNFNFSALGFGTGVSSLGDAMLMWVAQNYIETYNLADNPVERATTDATGMYFDTHWVSPGNTFRCNYIVGGYHCVYLDYTSSDQVFDGLVCINTTNGIKMNTGSRNKLTGVLLINSGFSSSLSCQYWEANNCAVKPGYCWGLKLQATYMTPRFKAKFPWLENYCDQTSVVFNNETIPCNDPTNTSLPNATATGNCSAMPLLNYLELTAVTNNPNPYPILYASCDIFPAVEQTTVQDFFQTTEADAGFINPANGDYGLNDPKTSSITQKFPNFRSCPRSAVGPKRFVPFSRYLNMFNKRQPSSSTIKTAPYLFC